MTFHPSSLRIALSGITGSISFACWIVLLIPQLIEQWKLKSADGIAIGTVFIWFAGDLANLIGSIWANLLTPVILLAVWFCMIDGSLMASYFYYKHIYPKHHKVVHINPDERSSLLQPQYEHGQSHEHVGAAEGHGDRHSKNSRRKSSTRSRRDSLTSLVAASSHWSIFKKYVLPLAFVSLAGVIGYFCSNNYSVPDAPDGELPEIPEKDGLTIGSQFFGYLSAALYLGARIPQIIYNHKRKSVYGLSLLFMLLSTFGNLTYSLQILFYRSDIDYIILNTPWLIGSLGAILEDAVIFAQFFVYRKNSKDDEVVEVIDEV